MEKILEYTVREEDLPCSVEQILRRRLNLSGREIRSAKFRNGGISVNGQRVRVTQQASIRDKVQVVLECKEEGSLHLEAVMGAVDILYEDEDMVWVNKPPGLAIHPGHGHYNDTLANYLVHYYRVQGQEIRIRAVGRLDKETSGVAVFAKNRPTAARLTDSSFAVEKEYCALVQGHLKEKAGCIERPIAKKAQALNQMEVSEAGSRAVTHYQVLREYCSGKESDLEYSLISLKLETGRTHQIRVHMASIGHPLLGDSIYGGADAGKNEIQRAALHCYRVKAVQPFTGKIIGITALVPEDMRRLIDRDSGKG